MEEVNEGKYANFSCTTKVRKGWVLWRIGNYTDDEGNAAQRLTQLEKISVEVYAEDEPEVDGRFARVGTTTRIGILATAELNGVAVQCVIVGIHVNIHKEYSKFAILKIHPPYLTG